MADSATLFIRMAIEYHANLKSRRGNETGEILILKDFRPLSTLVVYLEVMIFDLWESRLAESPYPRSVLTPKKGQLIKSGSN